MTITKTTPSEPIGTKRTDDYARWKKYWYAKLYGMSTEKWIENDVRSN